MENSGDVEFNTILFEKKLAGLKDSQESINGCCNWCLQNRQHHKKIVSCWLNVLKRVKVEQRLTLFYLANDVIQYSKRRNYDFVESWGTTLQKATTLVREEKVKHKILRIFKIWEERGVYGEEFVTDLCGLISASPSTRKGDESHEFQSAYLIHKIKTCSRLEADTDVKLRQLKEHNPKIQVDGESLISSLKDRAHVDDVEKEMEEYTKQMELYINALKSEIKARISLISLLTQAETQIANDKKDVKLVSTAYRTFASRVKTLKKKLDELIPTLSSPVPSPDINAPSPSPDSDIELPGNDTASNKDTFNSAALYSNAGYYNPVPPPSTEIGTNFNNNFSSFFGGNMQFSLANLNSTLFGNNQSQNTTANATSQTQTTNSYSINDAISSLFPSMACPPPPPAPAVSATPHITTEFQFQNSGHVPLMPPPMPPFSKADGAYGAATYGDTYENNNSSFSTPYSSAQTYQVPATSFENTATFTPSDTNFPAPATAPFPVSTTTLEPPSTTYEPFNSNYPPPLSVPAPYQPTENTPQNPLTNYPPALVVPLSNTYPTGDEYNPEEDLETWDTEPTWEPPPPPAVDIDTPESPPMFEKEAYVDPIEYHDTNMFEGGTDIDHRVLPRLIMESTADKEIGHRAKDVDHRNLISLTGSPNETQPSWSNQGDQDYRKSMKHTNLDQDYRVPFPMDKYNLLPPPPPPKLNKPDDFNKKMQPNEPLPPPSATNFGRNQSQSPMKTNNNLMKRQGALDNNESIDMDLSDDDLEGKNVNANKKMNNFDGTNDDSISNSLELPPPFPELLDDVDANNFLDNVTEELESFAAGDLEDMDQVASAAAAASRVGLLGTAPAPSLLSFPNTFNPAASINDTQRSNNNHFQNRGNFNNRGGPHSRGNWGDGTNFRSRGRNLHNVSHRGGFRGNGRSGFRNNNRGRNRNHNNNNNRGWGGSGRNFRNNF